MPVVSTSVTTPLSPAEVLRILTDFGPARAKAFPQVDDSNLTLHDHGDNWADVTEGNKIGWERERYDWDAEKGTITAVTTESNLWAAGSRWDYRLVPHGDGTIVEIRLERHAKGVLGTLVGLLVPIGGRRMITSSFSKALNAG